jgi:cell division protein FtsL
MTKKKSKAKKSGSANIFFFVVFSVVVFVFLSLFLKTEIKFLYKEIDKKENIINNSLQQLETKMVEVQKLSSEERIVNYAKNVLDMVRIKSKTEHISISKLKVKQIEKIVDSKYE